MKKRAAIYIRTSTEKQAENVSPQAQEDDCRAYCESQNYQVVDVYKDIQKYKVGKKTVEPSGTRADRPGLKNMLADAKGDQFDVVIAWREDRLYRSYRPMLDVLDCIEETNIDVELVKEYFDKKFAPVKAWAAKMELEAKHDRYMMGVAGRLSKGKSWNNPPPYGYSKDDDGYYLVNEDEAQWVKNLFEWYADEVSIRKIRERFISGGARQRNDTKYAWHMMILRRMLKVEYYWTGKQIIKWNDEDFEIPIPPIVSTELGQRVLERKAKYKKYPAGNTRHHYVAAGLVICAACGVKCNIVNSKNGYKKDGTPKRYIFYQCSNTPNVPVKGCFKRGSAKNIDDKIWAKVWKLISEPEAFEQALQLRIDQLQNEEINAEEEAEKLQEQLDELAMERQQVITWTRKKMITEEDMETQLLALSFQENTLNRKLEDKKLLIGNRAERMVDLAGVFRERVQRGWEEISGIPESIEEEERQLQFRRKIVQGIVSRVDIYKDKSVIVHADITLPEKVEISDPITCRW